jgi:hypothetical protein
MQRNFSNPEQDSLSLPAVNRPAGEVFHFGQNQIHVIDRDGEPWFVAAEVCGVLGISNPTMAVSRLDNDEQALITIEGISRGNNQANIINESGLYSLILTSRKPEAKRFKKWVTSTVLPQIRKTGGYQREVNMPMNNLDLFRVYSSSSVPPNSAFCMSAIALKVSLTGSFRFFSRLALRSLSSAPDNKYIAACAGLMSSRFFRPMWFPPVRTLYRTAGIRQQKTGSSWSNRGRFLSRSYLCVTYQKKRATAKTVTLCFYWSGRLDSNQRPLDPQS